jgi:hypothetical protein
MNEDSGAEEENEVNGRIMNELLVDLPWQSTSKRAFTR